MTTTSDDMSRTIAAASKGRWRKRLVWLAIIAALGFGSWTYYAKSQVAAVTVYETTPITRGMLTVTVTATGTVQPTRQVEISSEVTGTLTSVDVDFNDEVAVGQILARLDDTRLKALLANAEASLAGARARLVQAEATAAEAGADFAAQEELDARGLLARNALVTSKATNDRARAAVDIARADLTLAEANLSVQQADTGKALIRSPIKGIVLNRTAEVGQTVVSGLVLFLLAQDLGRMELWVDIDEADIGRVAVGNRAAFTVDAFPGRSFPATITQVRFAPETTDNVVTYKAILSVANPDRALRPGMTATAAVTVAEVKDTLQVANASLRYAPPQLSPQTQRSGGGLIGLILPKRPGGSSTEGKPSGHSVWVLRGGVPVEVAMQPGETDGSVTAIAAADIREGDLAITDQHASK